MTQDNNVADNRYPDMEDYGNTDGNWDKEEVRADQLPGSGNQSAPKASDDWDREDVVADGLNNTTQNSGQFGEFGNTGTGVDLTEEMDSTRADVRSGLVKGGQPGEAGLAGLGQYGGEAGDIPPQGTGNIDGNE